jgi:hypothetical protein
VRRSSAHDRHRPGLGGEYQADAQWVSRPRVHRGNRGANPSTGRVSRLFSDRITSKSRVSHGVARRGAGMDWTTGAECQVDSVGRAAELPSMWSETESALDEEGRTRRGAAWRGGGFNDPRHLVCTCRFCARYVHSGAMNGCGRLDADMGAT